MTLSTLSERELLITLSALTLLLAGAYVFGKLFEYFKAPKVVGEIMGGMLFGGSFLHHFFPTIMESIFNSYPEEGKVLNIFYQLGLIFLMFSSGFNTKIEVDKKNIRTLSCLFIGSTIIPMLLALPFLKLFQNSFIGDAQNHTAFFIVYLISIAITSIPVISKIFFDMGIMNTNFSNIVLTASTFQDLCLWILLNSAINIVSIGKMNVGNLFVISFMTIGIFALVTVFTNHVKSIQIRIKSSDFFSFCFIFLLLIIVLLSILKINIMYSAFIAGYIIKCFSGLNQETKENIHTISDFSFSFFIPIYFALVGIQLNVIHNFSFIRFIVFFAIAFCLEAIGTIIFLLFTNLNKKTILNLAITMNARGGPGIVLATVAYSYKIINIEFFTVLILTTMLSSLIAGYWLRNQQKKDSTIFMNLTKKDS